METLEKTLGHVESLRRDLRATIKIGEHYVEDPGVWVGGSRGGNCPGYYDTEPFSGYVDDYGPDTQKQEPARQKLQQVYDSNEWYCARYEAGRILRKDDNELLELIHKGVCDLRKRVRKTRIEKVKIGEHEEPGEFYTPTEWPGRDGDLQRKPGNMVDDYEDKEVPDADARILAFKDIRNLFMLSKSEIVRALINECYDNDLNEIKKQAGRALGYSELKIWAHEHPAFRVVGGISIAAGAAAGIGYLAYNYFAR